MSISQDDARITYKPKNTREEFFVFVESDQVPKWREDKSIPIKDVVQLFEVFENVNGGNEGIAGRPSKQRLENAFGTSNTIKVIEYILQHGSFHRGHTIKDKTALNETRGKGAATAKNAYGIHN